MTTQQKWQPKTINIINVQIKLYFIIHVNYGNLLCQFKGREFLQKNG